MATSEQLTDSAHFSVENIGGIDQTEVDIPPGVTVLTGKNATNRTSFLRSIMCAMGSQRASLKGDADEGRVEMTLDGDTYERTLKRVGDGVTFEGDGYLDDPEVADLFAFLLETNDARQAAARGDQLRDVIMRPVDVDAIRAEIRRLETEKGDINDELANIESRKRDLPQLEQRRNTLREKIEDKREELAELEDEIDDSSRDVEQGRKEQAELEEKLQELRQTRSELETIRRKIERQEESISSLKRERSDLESDLDDLPETPMGDHRDLESEIDRLRTERQDLNTEINELRSLIQYNEERLEAEDYELLQDGGAAAEESGGSLTDQLVDSDSETVVCWTCGSSVEREQIESTIDRLKSLRTEKVDALNDVKSQLEELKQEQREATKKQRRRTEIERKLDDIEAELDRRDEQIDALKANREGLTDEVESLESEVESLESADFDEILTLHKEANQLEFEIDSLESDLDDVTSEIEEIEADVERADDLREQRTELVDELTDQRTKIDQIEAEAVDSFNEHMESILDLLGYENIERIWIERIEDAGSTNGQTRFELHIVRTTENGAAYEDTIDHLSESEREVTGLIFALAGYLVHDLHESVPFMVLDSLEAIDSDRIAALVEYFADYADFLVVALLPEDAQALDDRFTRVTSI
ncbi:chromosome segregation protein SMC [Halobellus sp. Atlit-38R]|uniref:archaea-specific SMC-related protein n=1 Tax=Halobellus sp. Atlit-38R TaxID=2282131 RepID=UPI000EF26EA0|nr:archaea-specific SMC-related protein [Halobellus sp. Atlit-38R]RLM88281.1 chromosome segregation protein SMC [Halobellus sp. Atlit-38R]